MQELDEATISRSKVFLDDHEATVAGDLHIPFEVKKTLKKSEVKNLHEFSIKFLWKFMISSI